MKIYLAMTNYLTNFCPEFKKQLCIKRILALHNIATGRCVLNILSLMTLTGYLTESKNGIQKASSNTGGV